MVGRELCSVTPRALRTDDCRRELLPANNEKVFVCDLMNAGAHADAASGRMASSTIAAAGNFITAGLWASGRAEQRVPRGSDWKTGKIIQKLSFHL